MLHSFVIGVALVLAACAVQVKDELHTESEPLPTRIVRIDRSDLPLAHASDAEIERFDAGDALFEAVFREADGLGPLYIRSSCEACHRGDARGPGTVRRFAVLKAAAERSGSAEASLVEVLRFGDTERPYAVAGAQQPLLAPEHLPHVRVTQRLPPAVFGRGYLEAVAPEEIERLAREAAARSGSIRGRIHRLPSSVEGGSRRIGRFGLKGRSPGLDEFTADAFHGDMGLTSPWHPEEAPNPDGLIDDAKPGVDLSPETIHLVADYVRLLELPERSELSSHGAKLFAAVECATCHVSSLKTRTDYPISALADIEAPVYTDFLLHDMGEGLADGVVEGDAGPREWRTAPLIGLRFLSALLHDGRARNVEEAILAHASEGSEANDSIARFRSLSESEREELLLFVSAL